MATRLDRFAGFADAAATLGASVRPLEIGRGVEATVRMVRQNTTPTCLSVWCRRVADAPARIAKLRADIARFLSQGYIVDRLRADTPPEIRSDYVAEYAPFEWSKS